jgi:hypothetical protein
MYSASLTIFERERETRGAEKPPRRIAMSVGTKILSEASVKEEFAAI